MKFKKKKNLMLLIDQIKSRATRYDDECDNVCTIRLSQIPRVS